MSQAITTTLYAAADAPKSQAELDAQKQNILDAQLSSHSGANRPSYAVAGTPWLDADTGQWFFYDGTNDLPIAMFLGTVPASATAAGEPGQMFVVTGFLYVCIATDIWERAVLATF